MTAAYDLPCRPPYPWELVRAFLSLRATAGVEQVLSDRYERAVAIGGARGLVRISFNDTMDRCRVQIDSGLQPHAEEVLRRVRHVFDLDCDVAAVAERLRRDPLLRPLLAAWPGLRVPGGWDLFELAVRAVLGQQVTVRAATTMASRIAARFGSPLTADAASTEGITRTFPIPAALAEADLESLGLPGRRAETLRRLARLWLQEDLDRHALLNAKVFLQRLHDLPGIGPWTVGYIAMRGCGDRDAMPEADLVLRKAVSANGAPATAETLQRRSERWRPWRSYAALYLWQSESQRVRKVLP